MPNPTLLTECQVVSYRKFLRGERAIAGLKGGAAIEFHYMIHPKTELLESCYSDLLDDRVKYWREILRVNA